MIIPEFTNVSNVRSLKLNNDLSFSIFVLLKFYLNTGVSAGLSPGRCHEAMQQNIPAALFYTKIISLQQCHHSVHELIMAPVP